VEGGRERLSCFARNERISDQGKKAADGRCGDKSETARCADGPRSDMPNRGRDLGENLKTRPEMTLARVGVSCTSPMAMTLALSFTPNSAALIT
jgi:hypothetical protein